MCASVTYLLIIFVLRYITMVAEGLPLGRRERGAHQDIISGADFLSVFLDSPAMRQAYKEITTSSESSSTVLSSSEDEKIISVRISSSVGHSLINKIVEQPLPENDDSVETTTQDVTTIEPTETTIGIFLEEEQPSIVAEVNKSDFSVDEGEPITKISDIISPADFNQEYPASVQALPSPHSLISVASEYLNKNLQPYHETVIYHDNPENPGSSRSVSYSTVVHEIPLQRSPKTWRADDDHHERQERNYDIKGPPDNQFERFDDKLISDNRTEESAKNIATTNPMAESKNSYIYTKYDSIRQKSHEEIKENNWEKPEDLENTSKHTERNWGIPENNHEKFAKPYVEISTHPTIKNKPAVYQRPEQNYEVDESVSVMTNGRAHGVQSSQPRPKLGTLDIKNVTNSTKINDNQKFGYVVEGRDYRKYRVEERTSDGFIVGEYGVVSHNDGSLRGVRYTADGTINPRIISDTLMKFLSL